MTDPGVLKTATGLGVPEEVVGMAQGLAQQHSVGAGPAGADQERGHVLQRQRSAEHSVYLVTDMCVFVITGVAAPGFFAEDQLIDLFQFFSGVFVALGDI